MLAREGDKAQAQELLKQALKHDPNNADAWVVLAQVVENRDEAITYMKRAVSLQPNDERARRYLDYLLQQQDKPVEKPGPSNGLIIGLVAVAVLLCVGFVLAYVFLQPGAQQEQTTNAADCQALIEQALLLSDQGCQNIGSNEVCYGHSAIQAELAPGSVGQFDETGDVVKLDMLSRFIASPLDLEKKEWGIGVFKVEANVPGSLPGQAVTLLIFGSSVDNDSGDMRAFYFSSGLGSIVCDNVPFDGILVRMPDGTGVTFRANGADITMLGTGVMQAQEGKKMTVSMLTGTGKVSSDGQEQVLGPGQQVGVPLDGLEANGPPSYPGSAITDTLTIACTLTGVGCPGVTIPTISQADIAATQGVTPGGPTAVAAVTSGPTPTQRPGEPTWTPAPTATQRPGEPTWTPAAPTATQRPGEPTWTPVPTATPRPGQPTAVPPTAVPPTAVPPTAVPPTAVPPTAVPPTAAPPTAVPPTAVPPTAEPPPTSCDAIVLSWASAPNVNISNNNATAITLSNVQISWGGDGKLSQMSLGGANIWNSGKGVSSPTSQAITRNNVIASGATSGLVLTFKTGTATSPFSITLTFSEGGCSRSISN